MKSIFFATRLRGFFRQLINSNINASFHYEESKIYETNSLKAKLINAIGRSKIMDYLGIIHIIVCNKTNYDIIGSFNRFIKTKKPYFIYVENPTALYHYQLNRSQTYLGKKKIIKELSNPNLKALLFMSQACGQTFEKVCGHISDHCIHEVVYPLIPLNPHVTIELIKKRTHKAYIDLLFIAQGIRFVSKGGFEIIEAVKKLRASNIDARLHIITSFSDLEPAIYQAMSNQEGIRLDDFNFSFNEMQQIYANATILLQPTSDDSFNLTVLESIKAGLTIIASKLYAIPEMVHDGVNGFLCNPHYWFFDETNIPNPSVWNHRKNTIYSGKISSEIVDFIYEKIKFLFENRDILESMSLESLNIASNAPFSQEYIIGQWNNIISNISKD